MWDRSDKNRPSAAAAPAPNQPALGGGAEASVRQLIANGKHKVAVEAAKEIHKARPTAASEALLVDAYAARIQSLFDQNLELEAKSLLELVRARYPSARDRLNGRNGAAGMHAGRIEELVRPLNDCDLSAERRTAIEAAVAREVRDLAALAECAALGPEHPLRTAAAALQRAFLAATAGPVDEAAVELPEVSRRSPLAAWKLLVRAIACFYRGEDESCRRYLEAIQPETAPARLVPAMLAMLGGNRAGLTPAAATLVASTTSDPAALRKALEALEGAFHSQRNGNILNAIREAVRVCRENAPDELERLKQRIWVRGSSTAVNEGSIKSALGGDCRRDACFLRLLARATEDLGDPESTALACATWDRFRQKAAEEGWFAANGPEAATLYLHMAEVLRRLPLEAIGHLQKNVRPKGGKPGEELYFLNPDRLYERACALDPHFDSFAQWMAWAERGKAGQAERVAEAWHKIRPMDIEPILLLMEEKEKRNAFHTALEYLAKAERIDSVHPAVRRARLRLLAASVLRHIQQNKPHLADEKLAEMEALPESQQGDRPAFLAALRYAACVVRGATDDAAAHRAEVARLLGSQAAAALVVSSVGHAAKQDAIEQVPRVEALPKPERAALLEAVIRVLELARDTHLLQPIPGDWLAETARQFSRGSQSLTVGQLHTLAQAAQSTGDSALAYAVSAAGLERGGSTEASFLLLRAKTLPTYGDERWAVCAAAAAELARHLRQMDVVEKAVELLADSPFDDLKLTSEQAATVIRKEKTEREFPMPGSRGHDYSEFFGDHSCDCPACRRARAEGVDDFDDLDEDDDDDDDSDLDAILDSSQIPPDMPKEIAKILLDEARKAIDRGESLDSLMNRLFGPGTRFDGGRKKGRRK